MDLIVLRVGDELVAPGLFAHKMTYVGPIGPYGEDILDPAKGQPAQFVHSSAISNWDKLRLGKRGPEAWQEQKLVQARARKVVAHGVINRTLGPNCEHICSLVRTGESESPQLQFGVGVGILTLLIVALRS